MNNFQFREIWRNINPLPDTVFSKWKELCLLLSILAFYRRINMCHHFLNQFDVFQLSVIQFLFLSFFYVFLGPHLQDVELPRLEMESDLHLPAYTTTTLDPSGICNLHCHLQKCWSLTHWARPGIKPTSSQRQRQVLNSLSHNGNSYDKFLILISFFPWPFVFL